MNLPCIEPYLCFNGRCEEALEFYKSALDAEVPCIMRFSDSPAPCPDGSLPPGFEHKIMHSLFRVGSTSVMATDGNGTDGAFSGFSLSLATSSNEETARYFDALSQGGSVTMPLSPTFWSPSFGMVTDRFGVSWMVMTLDPNCPPA